MGDEVQMGFYNAGGPLKHIVYTNGKTLPKLLHNHGEKKGTIPHGQYHDNPQPIPPQHLLQ